MIEPRDALKNPEAEKATVGGFLNMLSVGEPVDNFLLSLGDKDFSDKALGVAFEIMRKFHFDGRPITLLILEDELKEHVKKHMLSPWRAFEDMEMRSFLCECAARGDFLTVYENARIVARYSEHRIAYDAGQKIAGNALSANGSDPISSGIEILENALDGRRAEEVEYRTAAEIFALGEPPEVPTLVDGIIAQEGITLLAGDTSGGKTFVALDAAIGIATGRDVWGCKVTRSGPVLFHGKDMSHKMLHSRLVKLINGEQHDGAPDNLHIAWGRGDEDFTLEDRASMATLKRKIQKTGAVLVVIDDLSTYSPNTDLNDASQVSRVMNNIRAVSNTTSIAFLVLTLLNKGSAASIGQLLYRIGGSMHIPGKADTAYVITRSGQGERSVRTMTAVKNRMIEEPHAISFQIIDPEHGGVTIAYEKSDTVPAGGALPEVAAGIFFEIIKNSDGKQWKRAELIEEYKKQGGKGSTRTISKVWGILENMKFIVQGKIGAAHIYSYEQDTFTQGEL